MIPSTMSSYLFLIPTDADFSTDWKLSDFYFHYRLYLRPNTIMKKTSNQNFITVNIAIFKKMIISAGFSVACEATLQPTLLVRPSISLLVHQLYLFFLFFLQSFASLFLPKWLSNLKYSPCPSARNWGSNVSSLSFQQRRYIGNVVNDWCKWTTGHCLPFVFPCFSYVSCM